MGADPKYNIANHYKYAKLKNDDPKGLTQKTIKKRSNEKKTRYFFLKLINKKSSPWYNNSITKNQKIKGDDINE